MDGQIFWKRIPQGIHYLRRLLFNSQEPPRKSARDENSASCSTPLPPPRVLSGAEAVRTSQGFNFETEIMRQCHMQECGRRYRRAIRLVKTAEDDMDTAPVPQNSWDNLPDDIILMIIKHARKGAVPWDSTLKSLRQVNKEWKAAVALSVTEIYLDLDGSQGSDYWKRLHCSFPNLVSLRATTATKDGIEKLSFLRNLKSLNLWGARKVSEGIICLTNLPALEVLNLGFTDISRIGLEAVSRITNLKSLDIRETSVTPQDIQCLVSLQGLGILKIGSSSWRRRDFRTASQYLLRLPELRSLDVGYSQASPSELKNIMPLCTIVAGGLMW